MSQHPNHAVFVGAIHGRVKLRIAFVAKSDGRRRERVCAPLDFGPSRRSTSQEDKYHLSDLEGPSGRHTLSISAEQIISMVAVGESFEPGEVVTWDVARSPWFVRRDWDRHS